MNNISPALGTAFIKKRGEELKNFYKEALARQLNGKLSPIVLKTGIIEYIYEFDNWKYISNSTPHEPCMEAISILYRGKICFTVITSGYTDIEYRDLKPAVDIVLARALQDTNQKQYPWRGPLCAEYNCGGILLRYESFYDGDENGCSFQVTEKIVDDSGVSIYNGTCTGMFVSIY